MVKEVYNRLLNCIKVYEKLIHEYPNLLPEQFYENVQKNIYQHAPYKTMELNKLLNTAIREKIFVEGDLSFEAMMDQLKNKSSFMEDIIAKSKDEKEIIFVPHTEITLFKAIEIVSHQIVSAAEIVHSYYDSAKLIDEQNKGIIK